MVEGEVANESGIAHRCDPDSLVRPWGKLVGRHDVEVRDREHPPPVVAVRVIEDVKLTGHATGHLGLVPQRSQDRLGQCFTLMQEGAWQSPASFDVGTFAFHEQNRQFVAHHRKNRRIDSDVGSRVGR
jgi:hypothetical protein